MSVVKVASVCLPVLLGVVIFAVLPAPPPEVKSDPVKGQSMMQDVHDERQKAGAAGLLGGGLVPAAYDTGEPSSFPWSIAPKASAQTQ